MKRSLQLTVGLAIFSLLLAGQAWSQQKKKAAKKRVRRVHPSLVKVTDDPKLPRVLLIGDSISMGYTVPVRKQLEGVANIHRIPTNGGPTTRGVDQIETWLGDGKWDVIHFNWGLHDLKYIEGKKQVSLKDYEQNLLKLVKRMKQTGAKLIWCNTTPVPEGVSPPRKNSEVLEYNAVAAKVMKEHSIDTNDLYTFAKERLAKIQRPNNVHFSPEGSNVLAQHVAKVIKAALPD